MGRASRTKETLPDFLKWRRVTRPPLVFRGLTGSQRTPGFWGVTVFIYFKLNELFFKKIYDNDLGVNIFGANDIHSGCSSNSPLVLRDGGGDV